MAPSLRTFTRRLRGPWHRHRALDRLRAFHAAPHSLEEVVDLALDFGGAGLYEVKTLQVRQEILALAEAVHEVGPRCILEIGTAHGGTTLIWAHLASERVLTCDFEPRREKAALFEAFPPSHSTCTITPLWGDSHDAAFRRQVIAELSGKPVDVLFLDGDHTAAGVAADYADYAPLVRPGGLIALHDILERQVLPTNQVYEFWKELKARATTEEFIGDPEQCGYGIGIVRV